MSKFARAAQTSQSLSLAAMEEASRLGVREADIEHMFLALVINDQVAGRALRDLGIDLDSARKAVEEQHDAQLVSLGINASFPAPGKIVFHETAGYQWSKRASGLIARSGGRDRAGDAAAVLRELLIEPSGLIIDLLRRLDVSPQEVLDRLDVAEVPTTEAGPRKQQGKGLRSGSIETFIPAPIDQVWAFLSDPARVPDWETSVGSIEETGKDPLPGTIWQGCAPELRPDGKPLKLKPQFHLRLIELVEAEPSNRVVWRFTYPDATRSNPILKEFVLARATGGTQVTISTSWARSRGWRGFVGFLMRPLQKFVIWIGLFQTGSAISRAFR